MRQHHRLVHNELLALGESPERGVRKARVAHTYDLEYEYLAEGLGIDITA